MSQKSPRLHAGALVDARGSRWRVVELVTYEDCEACRLCGSRGANAGTVRTLLLPFDRPRLVAQPVRLRRVGRAGWMGALRSALAADAAFDGLRGAARARLELHEYQLEPALASVRGTSRILVADEVGLGKTVQAGLVLADLWAREQGARALVLAPAGLCPQWVGELRDRFGLPAVHVDAAVVARGARDWASPSSPWERVPLAVASIDFVKQPEVLQGTATDRWDALVVDEAHLSAVAPERAAAVGWLARRSRRILLLTATPHSGDAAAFDALCDIGRLAGEGPIALFRRTRASLGLPVSRRVRLLKVRLSPAERRMHALLERYASRVWREAGPGGPRADARLAMIVLGKRAASGAAALAASVSRRLRWLARPGEAEAEQLGLPLGPDADEAAAADAEPGGVLAAPGLLDAAAERRALERLLELALAAVPDDSKVAALTRLLARAGEPAIVFTEYRDTLARLAETLAPLGPVATIHGGLDRVERLDAISSFTAGRARVLLATDAAAHGLNLHSRCRLVIDLELPWNPVRLEQRVGRVDRIGQRRTVHAVHLVAAGTGEEHVLARLASRVEQARRTLGQVGGDGLDMLGEFRVADGVFTRRASWIRPCAPAAVPGDAPPLASQSSADSVFVDFDGRMAGMARREVGRLEAIRRMASAGSAVPRGASRRFEHGPPWWMAARRRHAIASLPRGVVCIYLAEAIDGRGRSIEEFPIVLSLSAPRSPAGSRGDVFRLVPRPGSEARAALDGAALREAERRLDELRAAAAARAAAFEARERAIEGTVERVPVVAVQPGLFDRRALAAADRRLEEHRRQAQASASRLDALARASVVSLADAPRLVLALVIV